MEIKFATEDDADSVFALLSRCRDNLISMGIFQWDDEYPKMEYVRNDIVNSSLIKLTIMDKIAGVVSFDDSQSPEYRSVDWKIVNEPIAVIHRLAVDPLFQGKGYAAKLMNAAEQYIFESGFTTVRLDAYSGNEMLPVFYEKLGYERAGKVYFQCRSLPFICMEKSIDKKN